MKLCNNIVELRSKKESIEEILNFGRSVVSCLVSSFEMTGLRKAGEKITKPLRERCKRKREDDEVFQVDPFTKAG